MALASREGAPAAAYVALSPGSLSEASMRAIDPLGRPWWVIGSRHERFAIDVVRAVPELSRTARVTILEGSSHGGDILSPHDLDAEIADWFAGHLAGWARSPAWGSLERGAWAVGFQRATVDDGPRGTVLDTWYPAVAGGDRLRFGDYLALADDLRGAVAGNLPATLSATVTGDAALLDRAVAQRWLATAMAAVRDAAPAAGRFPVVLWTPRYGTTAAQAVLSEYLASHGFVVAFPRPAASRPMPFELADADARRTELAARVQDMRVALGRLRAMPNADATAVGVLAWSYTGEMATAFQIAEPSVALVAGLSTNLLDGWVYQPRDAAATLDASRLTAAYAVLAQEGHASIAGGRPFGESDTPMRGARYVVAMPGLAHGSFNALEGYLPSLFGIATVQRFSTSGPHGVRGYEAVATMMLRLLRRHVAARSTDALTELMLTSAVPPDAVRVVERGVAVR
jgi:dienelactone hydrolase